MFSIACIEVVIDRQTWSLNAYRFELSHGVLGIFRPTQLINIYQSGRQTAHVGNEVDAKTQSDELWLFSLLIVDKG